MALAKCRECKKEVSTKAKTCPYCGISNPGVKPSEMLAGIVGLAFIGFLAYHFIGGSSDEKSSPDVTPPVAEAPKMSDSDCRKDLSCWAEKSLGRAIYPCQKAVEHLANYSVRWVDGTFEMKFDHYRWLDQKAGTVVYIGDKAEFQNGYGAYQRVTYQCSYDPSTEKVTDAVANAGQLPD